MTVEFIKRNKSKSTFMKVGLVFWIVIGSAIFFVLFCHANSGKWLFSNSLNYSDSIQKEFSSTKEIMSVGSNDLSNVPYTNHAYKFSILFPQTWVVKNSITSESIIIKAINRKADGRFAAINIYFHEMDESINFSSLNAEEMFSMLYGTEHELLDSGEIIINGERSLWMRSNANKDGIPIYSITYTLAKRNSIFSLYGCTILGGETWFKENEAILKSSIKTFKFIDQ